MAAKGRKPTPNQQAWKKEEQRIKRFIKRAEKRGFVFESGAVPERPARVTKKRLEQIKAIKPEQLYAKAQYRIAGTGDLVSGEEGRRRERQAAARKAAKTRLGRMQPGPVENTKAPAPAVSNKDKAEPYYPSSSGIILRNVEEEISQWEPSGNWSQGMKTAKEGDRNILANMLEGAVSNYGRDEVAKRLQEHAEEVNGLVEAILYASGGGKEYASGRNRVQSYLVRMAAILKGDGLTFEERKFYSEAEEELNEWEEY